MGEGACRGARPLGHKSPRRCVVCIVTHGDPWMAGRWARGLPHHCACAYSCGPAVIFMRLQSKTPPDFDSATSSSLQTATTTGAANDKLEMQKGGGAYQRRRLVGEPNPRRHARAASARAQTNAAQSAWEVAFCCVGGGTDPTSARHCKNLGPCRPVHLKPCVADPSAPTACDTVPRSGPRCVHSPVQQGTLGFGPLQLY